jgi:hypothetical protein
VQFSLRIGPLRFSARSTHAICLLGTQNGGVMKHL